jgi:hypothetical protein
LAKSTHIDELDGGIPEAVLDNLERDALSRTRSSYILAINFMGLG